MDNIFEIYSGLIAAILYVVVVFFILKRKPNLNDFVRTFLSVISICGSLSLVYTITINIHNNIDLGVLDSYILYMLLGASSIIWISCTTIYSIYKSSIQIS